MMNMMNETQEQGTMLSPNESIMICCKLKNIYDLVGRPNDEVPYREFFGELMETAMLSICESHHLLCCHTAYAHGDEICFLLSGEYMHMRWLDLNPQHLASLTASMLTQKLQYEIFIRYMHRDEKECITKARWLNSMYHYLCAYGIIFKAEAVNVPESQMEDYIRSRKAELAEHPYGSISGRKAVLQNNKWVLV